MSTVSRIVAFVAALAVVFGLALGLGRVAGPQSLTAPVAHESNDGQDHAGQAYAPQQREAGPGGLAVSRDGYTLALDDAVLRSGAAVPVRFTITGPDGAPVTDYDVVHEQRLHLIAVRRDLTGFQHVHPELATDGTWSTGLDLDPGPWRLFADFRAATADALTLGVDVAVPGTFRPASPSADHRTAEVDGYVVTLEGDLTGGAEARLALRVERDGRPVADLQPYLGAYGHLVALRAGDLAYLHVHPDGTSGDGTTRPGPEVVFHAEVPSEGRYRLFLDFRHRGEVHTADFTVTTSGARSPSSVGDGAGPTDSPSGSHGGSQGDGHSDH